MKEISVTDSFMGLDKDTRKCQNIESYEDCKTRLYAEHLRKECGCIPLSLRLSGEVKYMTSIKHFLKWILLITGYFVHD